MDINVIYNLLLILGALSSSLYFTVRYFLKNKALKRTVIVTMVLAACLFLSLIGAYFVGQVIYMQHFSNSSDIISNEYYIVFAFFLPLVSIALPFIRGDKYCRKLIADSLLIFSFISRIGCLIVGCCGGKVINGFTLPIQIFELIFAFVVFILLRFIKNKDNLSIYALLYSVFRFLTEFARQNEGLITYIGLNIRQYLAVIVIIYILIDIILKGVLKNDKKNEKML